MEDKREIVVSGLKMLTNEINNKVSEHQYKMFAFFICIAKMSFTASVVALTSPSKFIMSDVTQTTTSYNVNSHLR